MARVLFVATVYGHLEAFHLPFIRLLMDEGHDVETAACPDGREPIGLISLGVKRWEIPFRRSPFDPGNIRACMELNTLFAQNRYDLIHVNTPVASFIGRWLARRNRQGRVLYTAHGFHFHKGAPLKNWLLYYLAERIARKWTDGLLVMNSEDCHNAQRLGYTLGKTLFEVHGVGVDLEAFSGIDTAGVRASLGIDPDDLVFCSIGELNANKNPLFLLDAWKGFAPSNPNTHLLFVGDGVLRNAIANKIRRDDIPRVHLLGYRHDVPAILSTSDIVLLVSKREGLPRCIMEAMACGKPVIATNIRGSRDLVRHGETGLLVKMGDIHGLVSAMSILAENQASRSRMGLTARGAIEPYALTRVLPEMRMIYSRYLPM